MGDTLSNKGHPIYMVYTWSAIVAGEWRPEASSIFATFPACRHFILPSVPCYIHHRSGLRTILAATYRARWPADDADFIIVLVSQSFLIPWDMFCRVFAAATANISSSLTRMLQL